MIPSALEFYDLPENYEKNSIEIMIEFAKLHCEAQREAILENVETHIQGESMIIDKESIKNAYPLTNIK